VANRGVFDGMSTAGHFCVSSPKEAAGSRPTEKLGEGSLFNTDSVCHATGLSLVEGRQYRITITIADSWFDKGILTDVRGFPTDHLRHYLALPLRRWWFKNWFQPVARIGPLGNYEYALEPAAPLLASSFSECPAPAARFASTWDEIKDTPNKISSEAKAKVLTCAQNLPAAKILISDIKARASGELFLYVNDAFLPWPKLMDVFYRNNSGTAKVEVAPIRAEAIIEDK
jgi:hypothetical protein